MDVSPAFPLLVSAVALGCAVNPATGSRQLMLVSESQEISMGRDYDKEVVASIGLYPDSALQAWIQQFGARLAATSERPNLPWSFRVVDDPVVNAFALPGGFIYVTRGILAHLNSEAELAGVVGHEIGHVTARHSASQMTKQQLAQVGLAVGAIASPEVGRYTGLASQALGVLFLKYSRDNERQADDLGLRYMRRVNYDPREMPHVFEMLARVSQAQGGGRVPEWLATHPDPENRRGRIEQEIAALPQNFTGVAGDAGEILRQGRDLLLDPSAAVLGIGVRGEPLRDAAAALRLAHPGEHLEDMRHFAGIVVHAPHVAQAEVVGLPLVVARVLKEEDAQGLTREAGVAPELGARDRADDQAHLGELLLGHLARRVPGGDVADLVTDHAGQFRLGVQVSENPARDINEAPR